jgi:hypothetical protein
MKRLLNIALILPLVLSCKMAKTKTQEHKFWQKGGYFVQTNIDLKNYDKGIIRAKVENSWQDFKVQQLPDAFLDWDFQRRLETVEQIKKGEMPELAGAHNGMVASHGLKRKDAYYSINNAVKGMGFLPKQEKLEQTLNLLKSTFDSSDTKKFAILESLYKNGKETFDLTKQVSLELYSTPDFETHTFLNEMTDPGVAIVFLDFPSYELRAITQLIHPANPNLTAYERNVVDYINTIHDYFHSRSPRPSIGVIYHVIEVFDNSPGQAKGVRIVPPLP